MYSLKGHQQPNDLAGVLDVGDIFCNTEIWFLEKKKKKILIWKVCLSDFPDNNNNKGAQRALVVGGSLKFLCDHNVQPDFLYMYSCEVNP